MLLDSEGMQEYQENLGEGRLILCVSLRSDGAILVTWVPKRQFDVEHRLG